MLFWGHIAALGTALSWSFTAIFFSESGKRIGSFRVNSIRLLFAVVIYVTVLLITTGRILPENLQANQFWWLAASGIIGLVIGDGCGFKALVMIGPRLTTLLWSTAPIMATIIAWFLLDEQLHIVHIIGILISMGGVVWVVSERQFNSGNHFALEADHPDSGTLIKGVLLGLMAAFGQAAGLVISKHAMLNLGSQLDPLPASFLRMIASLVVIWVYALVSGKIKHLIKGFKHLPAMAFAAGGAIVGPFLGVWMSLIAVSLISAGIAATLNAMTPILIIPAVLFYYKEKVSYRAVFGAILAVAGIVILFLANDISQSF